MLYWSARPPITDRGRCLPALTYIAFPNIEEAHIPPHSTRWSDIVRDQAPLEGKPVREPHEVATIIYTSGTTGQPKGVMRSFEFMSLMGKSMEPVLGRSAEGPDRMLSYLPLAHIAEHAIVEMNAIFVPIHIYFS
jgi:long-chain acyl-CoA synthetase